MVSLLLLALAVEAGFYLGQHTAFRGMGAKPKHYLAMQTELLAVQNTLRSQDAELEITRTRHEIDRKALELVRQEMAGMQEEIVRLEEGMEFYRSLMAPGEIAPGLSLRKPELRAGSGPREYFYRIVVQQDARKPEQLKGSLNAVVKGALNGEQVSYPLAELSEDIDDGGAALRFTYFQAIEGRLILPDGFEPGSISIEANTRTPHELEIGEEFPWQLQERFTHVGK